MPKRTMKGQGRPYRKKTYRRKTYRKKESSAKLALRVFESKKQEYRESETPISSLNGWYANASHQILTQNASYAGLIGHKVRGKGISFRGWLKNNATTTMLVRIGVLQAYRGSQITTDLYAGTNVLETSSGNTNVTSAGSAQKITGRFNQDQYKLIRSYTFKLGASSATDGSDVRSYKMWIPLNGQMFGYDGSGVLPSNDVYAIFVMPVLGNNDENLGENVEHTFTSTFYYVDI